MTAAGGAGGAAPSRLRPRLTTALVVVLVAGLAVLAASYLVPVVVPLAPAVDPGGAVDVSRPADDDGAGDDGAEAAPSAAATQARVVASTSCATPGARDTVTVGSGPASRVLPVESCGNRVGSVLEVEVPADGPARVRGTGASSARPDVDDTAVNGPATRVAVVLVVVAGLGTAGLVVAVARGARPGGRARGGRTGGGPGRRPARSPRRR